MNVLATGAFGYPNFGNESCVDILQSRFKNCRLDVQSRIDESDLRLNQYDITLLAGGGVLYHNVSEAGDSSLKYYLRYPAVAQWLGRKSMMLGVGTQGTIQPQQLSEFRTVFDDLDVCTVRDSYSARVLRESGIRSSVLECADLFYTKAINPNLQRTRRIEHRIGKGKPVLGVVASQPGIGVLHPEYSGFENRIVDALQLLEKTFRLHFFSFDTRSDTWLAASAKSWCSSFDYTDFDRNRTDSIDEFIRAFATVDAFITTRYHGVLLSTMMDTPFLAIGAPGEKLQRECEAVHYPNFLPYASEVHRIVESAVDMWTARERLNPILQAGARQRRRLALRNFELLDSELAFSDRRGSKMIPQVAASIRQASSFRSLVVWAAGAECWHEASMLFNQLPNFDCILPPASGLRHRAIEQRFLLPNPGIFNWSAFPHHLKSRLQMKYDNVIVCHEGTASKDRELLEIASACGPRVWDFNVWKHSIRPVSEDDIHSQSPLRPRPETVEVHS